MYNSYTTKIIERNILEKKEEVKNTGQQSSDKDVTAASQKKESKFR